jgi:hypothetical protein
MSTLFDRAGIKLFDGLPPTASGVAVVRVGTRTGKMQERVSIWDGRIISYALWIEGLRRGIVVHGRRPKPASWE